MTRAGVTPGPDAHSAYRLGLTTAATIGLLALGALYWTGTASLLLVGFALLVVFPIYLIYVASLLSVWLGFDKDATDLRPVYREREQTR